MISGTRAAGLSYEDFGRAFVAACVSPARVVSAVQRMAGDVIELGPLRAGPAGAASVTARGRIGEPVATAIEAGEARQAGLLRYAVRIPLTVSIRVRVGAMGRFKAVGEAVLHLTVRTEEPLALVIDVEDVVPTDVTFEVEARGAPARLMSLVADIEAQMRDRTVDYINTRVGDPRMTRLTSVELLPMIENNWARIWNDLGDD